MSSDSVSYTHLIYVKALRAIKDAGVTVKACSHITGGGFYENIPRDVYKRQVGFLAAFLNLAGNVIGFLPFGFIVPVMHKKMESFWKVSLLGFMFSLCVETIQLITKVGCFDVDDLILNTLGAMIGCGAFLICNKFRRWKYGEEEV